MNLWGIIKGLLVQEESDRTKQLSVEVDATTTTGKRMTVKSAHTDDRVLDLPDATDTLIGKATTDIITNKTVGDDLEIQGTTSSTTKDTGALVVQGGVGVEENLNVGGNTILTGNLTVNGTTTSINTTDLEVVDKNITVNKGGSDVSAEGAGLTVERVGVDGSLIYEDALASKFKLGALGSEKEVVDISSTQSILNKTIDFSSLGTNTIIADAVDINYDNTISGLTATNIKVAIDEVEGRVDTLETDIATKADRDLSNLTSPTAINQALIPNAGNTIDLGTSTSFFREGFIKLIKFFSSTTVQQGTVQATTSALTINGASSSERGTNGGAAVDVVSGSSTGASGSGSLNLKSGDTTNSNSGDINIQTGASTNGVRGNVILDGLEVNASTSKIINVVDPTLDQDASTKKYVDDSINAIPSGADTALSNLTSPTAINQDLVPDVDSTRDVGSNSKRFAQIHVDSIFTDFIRVTNGGSGKIDILTSQTSPNSITVNAIKGAFVNENLSLYTTNSVSATASGDTLVETGNNFGGGNSGNVILSPGPVGGGGVRGNIRLKDGSEGTVGHVWTSTGVGGEGNWAAASGGGGITGQVEVQNETELNAALGNAAVFEIIATASFTVANTIIMTSNKTVKTMPGIVISTTGGFTDPEVFEFPATVTKSRLSIELLVTVDVDGISIKNTAINNKIEDCDISIPGGATIKSCIKIDGQTSFIQQNRLNIDGSFSSPGALLLDVNAANNNITGNIIS